VSLIIAPQQVPHGGALVLVAASEARGSRVANFCFVVHDDDDDDDDDHDDDDDDYAAISRLYVTFCCSAA
jgi:hypothetical protein